MAKIKVCGINNLSFLKQIIKLKPNFLGFIFYKGSKRYIDLEFMKAAIPVSYTHLTLPTMDSV